MYKFIILVCVLSPISATAFAQQVTQREIDALKGLLGEARLATTAAQQAAARASNVASRSPANAERTFAIAIDTPSLAFEDSEDDNALNEMQSCDDVATEDDVAMEKETPEKAETALDGKNSGLSGDFAKLEELLKRHPNASFSISISVSDGGAPSGKKITNQKQKPDASQKQGTPSQKPDSKSEAQKTAETGTHHRQCHHHHCLLQRLFCHQHCH